MATKRASKSRPVIITTSHRGVFFGDLVREFTTPGAPGHSVELTYARNAIYWATSRGFLELADVGPNPKSKVGSVAARITLHDVTSVTDCTEAAAAAWREFP